MISASAEKNSWRCVWINGSSKVRISVYLSSQHLDPNRCVLSWYNLIHWTVRRLKSAASKDRKSTSNKIPKEEYFKRVGDRFSSITTDTWLRKLGIWLIYFPCLDTLKSLVLFELDLNLKIVLFSLSQFKIISATEPGGASGHLFAVAMSHSGSLFFPLIYDPTPGHRTVLSRWFTEVTITESTTGYITEPSGS